MGSEVAYRVSDNSVEAAVAMLQPAVASAVGFRELAEARREDSNPAPRLVDLRSDTVTKPTDAMRRAMAGAAVDDDVLGSDPTAQKFQHHMARILGKEDALFVPSGTMGNLISVLVHCEVWGSEAIIGSESHIHLYENGGISTIGHVHPRVVANEADGTMDLRAIEAAIRDPTEALYFPTTRLICLENTHARTARRGPQRVLTAGEPCINRWEMRWRRGGFPADRFAGGAFVRELRAGDLVADPYADVAWASDSEEAREPEDRPETPEHSGDRPGSAEGSQGMADQGQAPPAQEESVELADSDQEEAEEEISRRLEGYFPGIERHRLLSGAPPVAEAGHAWERAAMARDVLRSMEVEIARLQGQITGMREWRREGHGRSESRSRSTGSRQDPTVQQGSGQASRGEPSQGMPPPT